MTEKRKRDDDAAAAAAAASDAEAARNVALHYSGRDNQSTAQRKQSPIYHLRCLNNWIKSTIISAYVRKGDRVLDFACGKGGDLPKFRKASIGSYAGIDIALESVRRDAVTRYNAAGYPFPASFIAGDGFAIDLTEHLPPASFDVISCQFAIHYSWSTEKRARTALNNVARLLRPGGHFVGTTVDANVLVRKLREADGLSFGNSIVRVTFDEKFKSKTFPSERGPFGLEYAFTLADAVTDCAECMVPRKRFVEIADECGLECVEWSNFHEYVRGKLRDDGSTATATATDASTEGKKTRPGEIAGGAATAHELWRQTMGGRSVHEVTLSEDEWEAAYLYATFAFKRKGTSAAAAAAVLRRPKPKHVWTRVEPEDVLVLEGAA